MMIDDGDNDHDDNDDETPQHPNAFALCKGPRSSVSLSSCPNFLLR